MWNSTTTENVLPSSHQSSNNGNRIALSSPYGAEFANSNRPNRTNGAAPNPYKTLCDKSRMQKSRAFPLRHPNLVPAPVGPAGPLRPNDRKERRRFSDPHSPPQAELIPPTCRLISSLLTWGMLRVCVCKNNHMQPGGKRMTL